MKTTKRPRQSRMRTTARILEGARAALVERGWQDWGINAVSARSGVQKVLIYRYFEGMEGLCEALAAETVLFPLPGAESARLSPADLLNAVEARWQEDAFAAYLARLRPVLPPGHPFARAFDQQRAAFTTALETALRAGDRDPAEAPVHTALLLDFSRPGNTPLPA
ncbi:MAG: TetR/AcrR family transcriptional regulator, partial [Opitutales bacterium]|nr:TetR/AcrR family transcriptional regulator [Opitutales bacterium]